MGVPHLPQASSVSTERCLAHCMAVLGRQPATAYQPEENAPRWWPYLRSGTLLWFLSALPKEVLLAVENDMED